MMRHGKSNVVAWIGALASAVTLTALALTVTPALALPEGRVYEMVSPPYKGGYGAPTMEAVAPDGDSVAFYSPGAFSEQPSGPKLIDYVARRSASGWSTVAVMPPAGLLPYLDRQDVSSSLDSVLALGKPGENEEIAFQEGTEEEFRMHLVGLPDTEASNWELAGSPFSTDGHGPITLSYQGASGDLCHVFFASSAVALLAQAEEASKDLGGELYEVDRGCNGEPSSLRLVGLDNQGRVIDPLCQVEPGLGVNYAGQGTINSAFNAIAAGGESIFFTTNIERTGNCQLGNGDHQLFVRLGAAKTLEVSKPVSEVATCTEVPCEPGALSRKSANFVGASEDGTKVFFTTTQSYVASEDKDTTNDLYMATLGCPSGGECAVSEREVKSLVQVSHDPNGEAAGVQGVVRIAPDGEHAYFVASGDLLSQGERQALEARGGALPQAGADNLYVYDSGSGELAFVTDLCSGHELSGESFDSRCPSTTGNDSQLWLSHGGTSGPEAQSAGADGGFLVFSSYGQLVPGDTDTTQDVYRYDAQTGVLLRVSLGEAGADANGNDDVSGATIAPGYWGGLVAWQYEMNNRAISDDGSRIVFSTAAPLSSAASNGLVDVYEWHGEAGEGEGRVSLISSGTAKEPDLQAMIAPDGTDVFFETVQGLISQDTDGAPDIYDARLNGGFPAASAPRQACSGDSCQGPLTNPAPLLVPGSVSQAPGENFAPKSPTVRRSTKKKPKASKKKNKKKKGKAGRARRATTTHMARGTIRKGRQG